MWRARFDSAVQFLWIYIYTLYITKLIHTDKEESPAQY